MSIIMKGYIANFFLKETALCQQVIIGKLCVISTDFLAMHDNMTGDISICTLNADCTSTKTTPAKLCNYPASSTMEQRSGH